MLGTPALNHNRFAVFNVADKTAIDDPPCGTSYQLV